MASGDTLLIFVPQQQEPTATNPAAIDIRNTHPVLDMSQTPDEVVVFSFVLPRHYSGATGITVRMHYAMTSATANDIRLDTSFERFLDGTYNLGSASSFATEVNGTDTTVPGTAGIIDVIENAHTDGAQIDSLAVAEGGRLKIVRTSVTGTDAAGDLELRFVELRDT